MYRAKKRFGQHFLQDQSVIADIITHADLKDGDTVWEIGPGLGALTDSLIKKDINLTIFEIDNDLIPTLQKKYANECTIEHKDILKIDWEKYAPPLTPPASTEGAEISAPNRAEGAKHSPHLTPHSSLLKIVTNLPYQISSPFLYKLCENQHLFKSVVVMLQKEVAKRLCALPGKKDYGVLTLKTQFYFHTEYLFDVSADKFSPPPEVDSAVIKLVPRKDKPQIEHIYIYWKIVEEAFKHRRKTLRNNLNNLPLAHRLGVKGYAPYYYSLKDCPIDLSRRGETLSEAEFIILYDYLFPYLVSK